MHNKADMFSHDHPQDLGALDLGCPAVVILPQGLQPDHKLT